MNCARLLQDVRATKLDIALRIAALLSVLFYVSFYYQLGDIFKIVYSFNSPRMNWLFSTFIALGAFVSWTYYLRMWSLQSNRRSGDAASAGFCLFLVFMAWLGLMLLTGKWLVVFTDQRDWIPLQTASIGDGSRIGLYRVQTMALSPDDIILVRSEPLSFGFQREDCLFFGTGYSCGSFRMNGSNIELQITNEYGEHKETTLCLEHVTKG